MGIERRITFVIGQGGFASWKLNRLKTLSGFFRSVVILQNITTGEKANTEHVLKVISLGIQQNALCQLRIEGSDAELACMVLTDFVADQFEIVNTAHKRNPTHCDLMIEQHPAFHLPCHVEYVFESISVNVEVSKEDMLSKLSRIVSVTHQETINDALLKREAVSSTYIGHRIALPHIMIKEINLPTLVVFKLDKAINWGQSEHEVSLIIALFIPAPPTIEVVKVCTKTTRSLLNSNNCHLLTSSTQPEAIKAILFHFMARDMPSLTWD